MADKKHTAIKIEYDDGTIETVERGCAITLGEKDDNKMNVDILFATGDLEERECIIRAVLTALGVIG